MNSHDDCTWIEERFISFLEGELSAPELERFEQHIASCTKCSELIGRAQSAHTRLSSLPKTKKSKAEIETRAAEAVRELLDRHYANAEGGSEEGMAELSTAVEREREIVRQAVRAFLEAEQPSKLMEFDVVFDDVYFTIGEKLGDESAAAAAQAGAGLPFDAGMVSGTVISTACWIAVTLAKTCLDTQGDERAEILDRAEAQLASWTKKPGLVTKLRNSIQRLLE